MRRQGRDHVRVLRPAGRQGRVLRLFDVRLREEGPREDVLLQEQVVPTQRPRSLPMPAQDKAH